jgi:hypothetical protein
MVLNVNTDDSRRVCSALACPEIGVKWFLFFSCLFMSNMGLFDRQILAVLTDGKSRELRQILQEAGFSHTQTPKKGINTIFDHFRDKPARALCTKVSERLPDYFRYDRSSQKRKRVTFSG